MENGNSVLRVLCRRNIAVFCRQPGIYWFIGSPLFLPPLTVVSIFKCVHSTPGDPYSPDYVKEADNLKSTLLRGFIVMGALYVCDSLFEENATKAVHTCQKIKHLLGYDDEGDCRMIAASVDPETTSDIHFFASQSGNNSCVELITAVDYEDDPEDFVWKNGCLLRCQMEFKMPVYMPINGNRDAEMLASTTDAAISKLRDPKVVYLVEGPDMAQQSIVLRGAELSSISNHRPASQELGKINLPCSYFSKSKFSPLFIANKSADAISVRVFFSHLGNAISACAPTAEYTPAPISVKLNVFDFKVDVLCYASKDFPVSSAVSRLVIPGISDQLAVLNNTISLNISSQKSQPCPFHFCPPGVLHPITTIYDLTYGESEKTQVDIRRSLHLRLGLPLDRPLLLLANSVAFSHGNIGVSKPQRSGVIKDVHHDIPKSGVSGGLASLVDGSYEYYHYLQDGFDDSGWGCAYRSLQTIISWFILQHYTSIEVPSHREIQQALVEIGDKEPYFVGSREWIGAIELSFVLDKLLGVSCKIINVRSGTELPEKCRELSMHFETQGTPIMIGGGVLAYTLLGVDYNEVNGDCAFLILDPHYTSSDDRKKIANGGWCGWKKPVDNKGKHFFLHGKFYNLLLPQRPKMV